MEGVKKIKSQKIQQNSLNEKYISSPPKVSVLVRKVRLN